MARRLLIVAAEFPPVKGIGRLRPLKFCQHLECLGWDTAVLAPTEGAIQPVDPETLSEIPVHTKVYRAPILQPKVRMVRWAKSLFRKGTKTKPGATVSQYAGSSGRDPEVAPSAGRRALGHFMGRIDVFVRRNVLIPDDIALWYGPALEVGMTAIREFRPHVILATAPHFTNLIVGARLSRKSGVPWVADYRDLWTGDVLRAWVPAWRKRLELAIERWVLASASAVISVSEPKSEVLRARVADTRKCPVVTLTNGYDPEEFERVVPERGPAGKFRIVYAGRLFKNRRGYELIEAAGALLRERPELRDRLRIEYFGGVSPEIEARMEEMISSFALGDVVRFHPDVSYERSKALQMGADALLLIVDSGETSSGVIPGKLFEYVAARRPILCIAAEGATTEIIAAGRLGTTVEPGDVQGLAHALRSWLEVESMAFSPNTAYLAQFERARIVERLSELLCDVVDRAEVREES